MIVGHSEGAVHAMWLGAHERPAAVVLLAGYARPGKEALRWQGSRLADTLPGPVRALLPILRPLAARKLAKPENSTTDVARAAGLRMTRDGGANNWSTTHARTWRVPTLRC